MTGLLLIVTGYLLGSIPTSVWIGKSFYGVDVRKHGSRNAGATNTFRVLGKPAGSAVFFIDVAKGFFAVWLVHEFMPRDNDSLFASVKVFAAVAAVLGHVFPMFARFKGGKGVATAFGILIALTPSAAFVCFAIFLIIWLAFHYVSLGSIVAAVFYPLIQYFLDPGQDEIILIFTILLSLTVILSHRKNISRLLNGVETKTYAFRSKQGKKS